MLTHINIVASVKDGEIEIPRSAASPKTQCVTGVGHVTRYWGIIRNSKQRMTVNPSSSTFMVYLHVSVEMHRSCKLLTLPFPRITVTQPIIRFFNLPVKSECENNYLLTQMLWKWNG